MHEAEDPGIPAKAPLGEHIAVQRAHDGGNGDGRHDHEDGVQEVGLQARGFDADLCRGPCRPPRVQRPDLRQGHHVAARDLLQRLHRVHAHDVERQQVEQREEQQEQIDEGPRDAARADGGILRGGGHHFFSFSSA